MTTCTHGKRFKPLPLRRGFWRELPKKIKEGIVIVANDGAENEDIRNAAQSILISCIEPRLMSAFKRPSLRPEGEFYTEFFTSCMHAIRATELQIWEEMSDEIDHALSEQPGRTLSGTEAAYLTYAMLGLEEPPQSFELYINLAVFAQVYEELLKNKYGTEYTSALFYKALRTHMPLFLLRLIGMDSVLSMLLTMNAKPRDLVQESPILSPGTILESRFMTLGDDDSFSFCPKFIEAVCKHAQEHGITEDAMGRTEDRGCPILFSPERDAIIRFSIEELIAQHERKQ